MFFSMGFLVTMKGKVASPLEAPIFVVAPHSTFFDGIACVIAGLPSLVSRNENAPAPLIGSKYLQHLKYACVHVLN
jgi:lysophosphatidylcholine acyltransferase/lyso-PAF acetyltransferase